MNPMQPPSGIRWSDVPKAFWAGLVLSALGFVVNVTSVQVDSSPAGVSCSYTNWSAFVFAVAILGCVAAAWQEQRRRNVMYRLMLPAMAGFSVILVGFAVVHALRGAGTVGGDCN